MLMLKTLHLTSFTFAGLLAVAPALAAEGWDHRAMQSHHQAVDRAPRLLAPGETRIGRIEIGATTSSAKVPETLPTATQRQWIQRSSFSDGGRPAARGGAPRVKAGRSNGPRGSHSTSIR
jgi:hypothetical protein